ncbi:CusA/CzcA family heavy metal efflux RND transporter [Nannocystis sp. SCPEA4]|uniref:efflux RND transporter permease subunit n=1 Tax=Nannocystis sp. SCPEA4 TaxID=2996787 RepID=UPI00226DBCAF|nr:CusA/CzcA family heavy metal efflux RND transporter [Nannocystis sp. SCPEA4]MCY1056551.1 CusA/CzcA family heavy metal efflux RND transporter [Nannocystis sp. SCPEA4]
MLGWLIHQSIQLRLLMLGLLLMLLVGGGLAARSLPIDALPDISTIQVSVLTEAPGLSAPEVERNVTFPMENALNGVPGLEELRSVSRADLSAITVVFRDGTDPWFARQLVFERMLQARGDLPAGVPTPQLAPLSTGLGEIYQFVVRSPVHSRKQLRTLLDWEIVPRLRGVPGVIEVNTQGGELKQYQVIVQPDRLAAYGLTLRELSETLSSASAIVSGGYIDRTAESFTLRAVGTYTGVEDLESVVLKVAPDGTPILVKHVASVRDGAALRHGIVTYMGEDEAVAGVIMMLLGSNSRDVIYAVKDRVAEVQAELPAGVVIEAVYDRAEFVERTLSTVVKNILEGAAVVFLVLIVLLGSVRGALVCVLGIPASMSVALFGMHWAGVAGDLMSLGAIDFGFLVDGPIVLLEALIATFAGQQLTTRERAHAYAESLGRVVRPVAFAVAIIMLVYIPLLSLEGVEGRLFKPMATTMAFALFGALVYSVVFLPALLALFVPPAKHGTSGWLRVLTRGYERALPWALKMRWPLLASAAAALVVFGGIFAGKGADFVPRIDEGDMVVSLRRPPSINLTEAKRLDLEVQKILLSFPEVEGTLAFTGRAEVAIDPAGKDKTDIVVPLKPKEEWVTAHDLDGLSVVFKDAIESQVPSTFVSISQPIEDRNNEIISGSRADIQIMVLGPDLLELKKIADAIAAAIRPVEGTGDLRVEQVLGMPELTVKPDRTRLARYGVALEDALLAVEAARVGLPIGLVYEGQRRFDARLLVPPREPRPEALGDLFVETVDGHRVPLSEVALIEETEGPAQIRRQDRVRVVRVEVNLRGRDLVSWVNDAMAAVDQAVPLTPPYKVTWSGQFENFQRASQRLAVVVPICLILIFGMLLWNFRDVRYAAAVFALVPFALIGGLAGLILRDMSFSIPAAVGFIALAGVAVLNGVVLASEVRGALDEGHPFDEALLKGSSHTMRAVLTTGAVAALGFLPMALATGAGSEVQRPLATTVVFGIGASTILTLFLLPALLRLVLRRERRDSEKMTHS